MAEPVPNFELVLRSELSASADLNLGNPATQVPPQDVWPQNRLRQSSGAHWALREI